MLKKVFYVIFIKVICNLFLNILGHLSVQIFYVICVAIHVTSLIYSYFCPSCTYICPKKFLQCTVPKVNDRKLPNLKQMFITSPPTWWYLFQPTWWYWRRHFDVELSVCLNVTNHIHSITLSFLYGF